MIRCMNSVGRRCVCMPDSIATSTSADVVMRRVYGALLVAMLVVCRVCAESGRV